MLGEEVAKVADVDPAVPTRSRVRFELPPPDPVDDCLLRHVAVAAISPVVSTGLTAIDPV